MKKVILTVLIIIAVSTFTLFAHADKNKNNASQKFAAYTNYSIAARSTLPQLEQVVRYQIENHKWQPLGGVTFDGKQYLQVLVK